MKFLKRLQKLTEGFDVESYQALMSAKDPLTKAVTKAGGALGSAARSAVNKAEQNFVRGILDRRGLDLYPTKDVERVPFYSNLAKRKGSEIVQAGRRVAGQGVQAGRRVAGQGVQAGRRVAGQAVQGTKRYIQETKQAIRSLPEIRKANIEIQKQGYPKVEAVEAVEAVEEKGIPKWAIASGVGAGALGLGGGAYYLANRKRRYER